MKLIQVPYVVGKYAGAGEAASKRRNSHMCCHEFCQRVPHHSEDLAVLFIGMPLGCLTVSCVPHGNRAGWSGLYSVILFLLLLLYTSLPCFSSLPCTRPLS